MPFISGSPERNDFHFVYVERDRIRPVLLLLCILTLLLDQLLYIASVCYHVAGLYGRGTVMDPTACCREGSTIGERFDCLTDVYRCFLTGSCPSQSAADVAGVIFSGVCALVPGEDRECVPAEYTVALTCSSLTLVEKMTSSLTSQSQPPEITSYCTEILRMLFQDMDLMSQLVSRMLNRFLHSNVKCFLQRPLETPLFHRFISSTLRTRSSPIWLQRVCQQVFSITSTNM